MLKLVDRYHPIADLALELVREASARSRSVYDLYYAVLARRADASVLTIDARLRKLIAAMGVAGCP